MKPLRNRLKVVILLILDVVNLAVSVVPALLTKRDECCCFNLTRQNSLKKMHKLVPICSQQTFDATLCATVVICTMFLYPYFSHEPSFFDIFCGIILVEILGTGSL